MAIKNRGRSPRQQSLLKQARTNLISRTARVWSKLGRSLVSDLKGISQPWVERVLKAAMKNIEVGYLENVPALPARFERELRDALNYAALQGFWLQHVYMKECEAAMEERLYHVPADDPMREALQKLTKYKIELADEWTDIVPQAALEWLKGYTPKLAGKLEEDTLKKVNTVVAKAMEEGLPLKERMEALKAASPQIEKMADTRVEAIVRTEITRADNMGRLTEMTNNPDVIGVEFSAVLDGRTTVMCDHRHGLFMKIDDPRLPYNTPPLHVHCVLGDTHVLPIGRVAAYSERVFDGDVIVIESARGNHLTGTPNHPVLTGRGWVALGEVVEGDYVICDALSERRDVIDGNHQEMPARIEDKARAFLDNRDVISVPVPVTAEDFHGDGLNGEVAIINADRELWNGCKAALDEHLLEYGFVFGDMLSIEEVCNSRQYLLRGGFLPSSSSLTSLLREPLAFFRSSSLHSGELLFMPVAGNVPVGFKDKSDGIRSFDTEPFCDASNPYTLIMQADDSFVIDSINGTWPLNAALDQNVIDCVKTGVIFLAKFIDGETREVVFDKIISVKSERFSGHVYNLQSSSGTYFAGNILTHNCRSLLLPVTTFEHPDGLLTSHEFDDGELPEGIQRPEDIEAVREVLGQNAKASDFAFVGNSLPDPEYEKIADLDPLSKNVKKINKYIEAWDRQAAEEVDAIYQTEIGQKIKELIDKGVHKEKEAVALGAMIQEAFHDGIVRHFELVQGVIDRDEFGKGKDKDLAAEIMLRETPNRFLLAALKKYRDIGGVEPVCMESSKDNKAAVELIKRAATYLPSDWVARALVSNGSNIEFHVELLEKGSRANATDTESGNEETNIVRVCAKGLSTAIHELVHIFEARVPAIGDVGMQHLKSRTKGEKPESIAVLLNDSNYSKTELTLKDKFLRIYMGRDYSTERNKAAYSDEHTEVMSMGIPALLFNHYDIWYKAPQPVAKEKKKIGKDGKVTTSFEWVRPELGEVKSSDEHHLRAALGVFFGTKAEAVAQPVRPAKPKKPTLSIRNLIVGKVPEQDEFAEIRGMLVEDIRANRQDAGHGEVNITADILKGFYKSAGIGQIDEDTKTKVGVELSNEEAEARIKALTNYMGKNRSKMWKAYEKDQQGKKLTKEEKGYLNDYKLVAEVVQVMPTFEKADNDPNELYLGIKAGDFASALKNSKEGMILNFGHIMTATSSLKEAEEYAGGKKKTGVILHLNNEFYGDIVDFTSVKGITGKQDVLIGDLYWQVTKTKEDKNTGKFHVYLTSATPGLTSGVGIPQDSSAMSPAPSSFDMASSPAQAKATELKLSKKIAEQDLAKAEKLRDAFKDAPDFIKNFYERYIDNLQDMKIDELHPMSGSYDNLQIAIAIGRGYYDDAQDFKKVIRHEMGHFFDQMIAHQRDLDAGKDKDDLSIRPVSTKDKDFIAAVARAEKLCDTRDPGTEALRAKMRELVHLGEMRKNKSVSDIFSAITHARDKTLYGDAYHSEEYYSKLSHVPNMEIFANLTALYASNDQKGIDFLLKNFPELFNDINNEYLKLMGGTGFKFEAAPAVFAKPKRKKKDAEPATDTTLEVVKPKAKRTKAKTKSVGKGKSAPVTDLAPQITPDSVNAEVKAARTVAPTLELPKQVALQDPDIASKVRDVFEDAPEFIRALYTAYKDDVTKVSVSAESNESYYWGRYDRKNKRHRRDITIEQGAYDTNWKGHISHEMGHHFDLTMGRIKQKVTRKKTLMNDFLSCNDKEFVQAVNMALSKCKGGGYEKADLRERIAWALWGPMKGKEPIGDIFAAITQSRNSWLMGAGAHDKAYFRKLQNVYVEIFANLVELYASKNHETINFMVDYFSELFEPINNAFLKLTGGESYFAKMRQDTGTSKVGHYEAIEFFKNFLASKEPEWRRDYILNTDLRSLVTKLKPGKAKSPKSKTKTSKSMVKAKGVFVEEKEAETVARKAKEEAKKAIAEKAKAEARKAAEASLEAIEARKAFEKAAKEAAEKAAKLPPLDLPPIVPLETPLEEKIFDISKSVINQRRGERGHKNEWEVWAIGIEKYSVQTVKEDFARIGRHISDEVAKEYARCVTKYTTKEYKAMRAAVFKSRRKKGFYTPGDVLTQEELKMIDEYAKATEYIKIASLFKSSRDKDEPYTDNKGRLLVNEKDTIYRGLKDKATENSIRWMSRKPGDYVDLEIASSFSSERRTANDFAEERGIIIRITNGNWRDAVSIKGLSAAAYEDEVFVAWRKWKVVSTEHDNSGRWVITIEPTDDLEWKPWS